MGVIPNAVMRIRKMSWALVFLFISMGIWLFFRPSVGEGGMLLALAAVLMPLLWEKITLPGQIFWLLTLVGLVVVEFHAIRIDRAKFVSDQEKFARDQKCQRELENDHFQHIATELEGAIQQNQKQFGATMGKFQDTAKRLETAQKSLTSITDASAKRQRVREKLTDLLLENIRISRRCNNVGGRGKGGSHSDECIEDYKRWKRESDTFIQTLEIADLTIFTTEKSIRHAVIDPDAPEAQEIATYVDDLDAKADAIEKLIHDYR